MTRRINIFIFNSLKNVFSLLFIKLFIKPESSPSSAFFNLKEVNKKNFASLKKRAKFTQLANEHN